VSQAKLPLVPAAAELQMYLAFALWNVRTRELVFGRICGMFHCRLLDCE